MENPAHSRAPLRIAIVLMVVPMLYVGSYLLQVWPDAERFSWADSRSDFPTYRYGTQTWAGRVYWPLEQIDRKVRSGAWQS